MILHFVIESFQHKYTRTHTHTPSNARPPTLTKANIDNSKGSTIFSFQLYHFWWATKRIALTISGKIYKTNHFFGREWQWVITKCNKRFINNTVVCNDLSFAKIIITSSQLVVMLVVFCFQNNGCCQSSNNFMFLPLGGEFIFKGTSVFSDTYCTFNG